MQEYLLSPSTTVSATQGFINSSVFDSTSPTNSSVFDSRVSRLSSVSDSTSSTNSALSATPPNKNPEIHLDEKEKTINTSEIQKNTIESKTLVYYSFYVTFVFLTTTATVVFIEAMRTKNPLIRHLFNLETAISIIASFFYYSFITKLDESRKLNIPINWAEFTLMRYIDWSITTPFMLLSLALFLSINIKIALKFNIFVTIIILNYIMLLFGFLGEIGTIPRITSFIIGFIALFTMISIFYLNFIKPKYNLANIILFSIYFLTWLFYGIVYLFSEEYKNIAMNILDLISKCFIGIGMWVYFTNIVKL